MFEGRVLPHVISAIEQLYAANWQRIDARDPNDVGALFAENGVLEYGDDHWAGRGAINGFYNPYRTSNKARGRVTRHLSVNHRVAFVGYQHYSVRGAVFVFSGIGGERPLAAAAPSGIGDFDDECFCDDGGRALFLRRRTTMIFASGATFDFSTVRT